MTQKNLLLFLFLTPILWCFSEIKKDFNSRDIFKKTSLDSIVPLSKFDFNYIKLKTKKLRKQVSVNEKPCNENTKITKEFIATYLSSQKTVIGDYEYLNPTNYDGFCLKQHKEFKNYNLFTFTYDNGTCCRTLYVATVQKKSLEIINIGVLAFSGSENGWLGDKYGKWIGENVLDMVTVSYYDDDFVEDNNNSRVDTTWSVININQQGILKENNYKRVRYLEGRKME
ncbi:hypothetical protein FHR24_001326 [Wenyingzhuangia heitensis]|uniref:Uncharacterized protein n=1 Tax=Wenyingzhuangia heitensis TaxID=1487859 RepID=A0ABX0U7Q7_9FLAO|nr:hypothetical protein [Wenyingzhuangia heitensis]NIJ44887.1 hypothetical protein [Wenyingzhuangia heitensis]